MRTLRCFLLFSVLFLGAHLVPPPLYATSLIEVLIEFKSAHERSPQILGSEGTIRSALTERPVIAARIPQEMLEVLRKNPSIRRIEPNLQATKLDLSPETTKNWGIPAIQAPAYHQTGNGGHGVVVGIVDSGSDSNHPDLRGTALQGYDFVNDDSDPMDDDGHGTHVAGIIAAQLNDQDTVGVSPEASLIIAKVLDENGRGYWSDILQGIEWSIAQGARIINISLGSSTHPGSIVESALQSYADQGVILVAAAGNNGGTIGYPARFSSTLAVGAIDQVHQKASFSSYGAELDVVAPGVSIVSSKLGGGTISYSGTSMAAPFVSGAAALLAKETGHTGEALTLQILNATKDLGSPGRDDLFGHGMVQLPPPGTPASNTAPLISILAPTASSTTMGYGSPLLVRATAIDAEEGTLTDLLQWTSSHDGALGMGGETSLLLRTLGTHTVRAQVTDSGGLSNTASRSVTLLPRLDIDTFSVTRSSASYATVRIAFKEQPRNVYTRASTTLTSTSTGFSSLSKTISTSKTGIYTTTLRLPNKGGCNSVSISRIALSGYALPSPLPSVEVCL